MAVCHPLAVDEMKSLLTALLAVVALVTSLLAPAPALALATPHTSLAAPHSLAVIFMTKKSDAQAKKVEGRLQSTAGDLTGKSTNKVKGAAKQVQGSAMSATADLEKGAKLAGQSISDSARGFGKKVADKTS
jgi:uncharacterized protein YjbJ (UPF0337 family)